MTTPSTHDDSENSRLSSGLLDEAELRMQLGRGIFSDPDVKLLRFDDPLFRRWTPELQFIRAEREMNGLFRARGQAHPSKAFQLSYRARSASSTLVNVELHDGISGAASGVAHID